MAFIEYLSSVRARLLGVPNQKERNFWRQKTAVCNDFFNCVDDLVLWTIMEFIESKPRVRDAITHIKKHTYGAKQFVHFPIRSTQNRVYDDNDRLVVSRSETGFYSRNDVFLANFKVVPRAETWDVSIGFVQEKRTGKCKNSKFIQNENLLAKNGIGTRMMQEYPDTINVSFFTSITGQSTVPAMSINANNFTGKGIFGSFILCHGVVKISWDVNLFGEELKLRFKRNEDYHYQFMVAVHNAEVVFVDPKKN